MNATSSISARVDATTLKDLDRLAEELDRSRSWLVAQAVREYVDREAEMLAEAEHYALNEAETRSVVIVGSHKWHPGVIGIEPSRDEVRRLHEVSLTALEPLGEPAEPLRQLSTYMAVRTK